MPTLVAARQKQIRIAGEALTGRMAALLLEHADGTRPTRALISEMRVLRSLKERGLIKFNRFNRPTRSMATTRGQAIIVALLAGQTDAEPSTPVGEGQFPASDSFEFGDGVCD